MADVIENLVGNGIKHSSTIDFAFHKVKVHHPPTPQPITLGLRIYTAFLLCAHVPTVLKMV